MPRWRATKFVSVLFLAALAATTALQALPRPHRKANPREQVVLLEEQWRQAQLADDIPAMEKLLSDNYIGITVSGKVVTKAQQLERMRRREVIVTSFQTSETKVKMLANGQVAIVNSLAVVQGKSDERSINGSYRYTRVYQRTPAGSWKITSFEATRIPGGERPPQDAPAAPAAPPSAAPTP